MSVTAPQELLDRAIPDGEYELSVARHEQMMTGVYGADLFTSQTGQASHPIFAHLVTHCGMGWTFDEFLQQVDARHDDGVVFGGGTFTFHSPLLVGTTYRVRSRISDVTRKVGRRVGTFDAITVSLDVTPVGEDDRVVVSTTETYIVPRRGEPAAEAPSAPTSTPVGQQPGLYTVGPVARENIVAIMDLMDDTNPVHLDAELARASGYRGPVNQGPANLAYVFNALRAERGHLRGLRRAEFQFRDTVTEGDLLQVETSWSPDGGSVDATLVIVGAGTALTCRAEFDAVA